MNVLMVTHKERSSALFKAVVNYSGFDECHIFCSASVDYEKMIPKNRKNKVRLYNHRHANKGKLYAGLNWNNVPPLSKALVEEMAPCEVEVLKILERVNKMGAAYESRKKHYMQHLRYWDYFLDKKKIGVFIRNGISGAAGYDHVIYHLCKRKGIPTYMSFPFHPGMVYWTQDFKRPLPGISERYSGILFSLSNGPLPDIIPALKELAEDHWERKGKLTQPVNINRTSRGTARKTKQALEFYDRHAVVPDYKMPYIYHALHYQPEATTAPLAGPFVDQILITEILSRAGVPVYVKEHPHMSKNRSVEYYARLLNIPSVQLVSRRESTYKLIDNARAVATATGTAGWEAILRGKPALVFGNIFWQHAPGAFSIGSVADLEEVMERLQTWKPNKHKLGAFLAALGDYIVPEADIGKALLKLVEKR